MTLRNSAHSVGRQPKRFVPVDPLPSGIGIVLWPCSLERVCQSFRVIYQFGGGPTLRAKCLTGRMRGIRMKSDKVAVFDFRNAAAAGDAQSAISLDPLRATLYGHGIQIQNPAYCGANKITASTTAALTRSKQCSLVSAYSSRLYDRPPF